MMCTLQRRHRTIIRATSTVAGDRSVLFPSVRGVDAEGGRGVLADWLIPKCVKHH